MLKCLIPAEGLGCYRCYRQRVYHIGDLKILYLSVVLFDRDRVFITHGIVVQTPTGLKFRLIFGNFAFGSYIQFHLEVIAILFFNIEELSV